MDAINSSMCHPFQLSYINISLLKSNEFIEDIHKAERVEDRKRTALSCGLEFTNPLYFLKAGNNQKNV